MSKELTDKQRQYMNYLARGFSDSDIAINMRIARDTVISNYRDRMLAKIHLYARADLVEYAKQNGYGETNGQ